MPQISFHRRLALAAAAGVLYYLGFSPLGWWPLTFPAVMLLIWLLDSAKGPREAAAFALLMKTAQVAPLCPYLSGLGTLVHLAAVGIHIACWGLMAIAFTSARAAFGPLAALLALPGLWTWAEWLGITVHFLPSHVTSWPQALAVPGLHLAPYVGVYGLSTLSVAVAAAPWAWRRAREFTKARRPAAYALLAVAAAALALPPVLGRLSEDPDPGQVSGRSLRVAAFALEANDAMEKSLEQGDWTPERAEAIQAHILERTAAFATLLGRSRPDLVILPEDAIDFVLPSSRSDDAFRSLGIENNGMLLEAYRALARLSAADLAVGLTTLQAGRRYNSTALIGKEGAFLGLRHKWRLTPGSEYWPIPSWLPVWLFFSGDQRYVNPDRTYSVPPERFPLLNLRGWTLGAATCLEGHMPATYLGWRRAGAELVLFMGNAHWFHWDPYKSNIHLLRMVRLSAAAYGLPIVMTGKASNAGAVDPRGGYQVWPGILDGGIEEPHEVVVTPAPRRLTVAVRWGEYYLPLSVALALLASLGGWLLTRRTRSN